MNIKGESVGNAGAVARHIGEGEENEQIEVKELRGVSGENVAEALAEMEAMASIHPTKKPLYHGKVSPEPGQPMTPERWQEAIDALEKKLGFEGQPRVVVHHTKKGREHAHVVWLRVDLDRNRVISDSYNYRKHEEVSRDLERRFGHNRVQGAHAERDGQPRPERRPYDHETQRGERTGLSPDEAKALVRGVKRVSEVGRHFKINMESHGWLMARGKRGHVLVDPYGSVNTVARLTGERAADVRAFLHDVPLQSLPTVEQAQDRQAAARRSIFNGVQEKQDIIAERAAEILKEQGGRDTIRLYRGIGNNVGQAKPGEEIYFTTHKKTAAVYGKIHYVDISVSDLQKFTPAHGGPPIEGYTIKPSFYDDWTTNDPGIIARLRPVEADRAQETPRDPFQAAQQTEARRQSQIEKEQHRHEQQRAAAETRAAEREKARQEFSARREGQAAREMRQTNRADERAYADSPFMRGADGAKEAGKEAGLTVRDFAANTTQRLTSFVGGLLGAMLGGGSIKASYSTESPTERAAAYKAQRLSRDALRSIRDSIDREEPLRAEDVRNLSPDILENIRARGDAGLMDQIRRMEEERTRDYERGRTREL